MMKLKRKISKKKWCHPTLTFQTRDPGYETESTTYEKITKLDPQLNKCWRIKLEEEKINYKKGSKIKIEIKIIMIKFEIKIN